MSLFFSGVTRGGGSSFCPCPCPCSSSDMEGRKGGVSGFRVLRGIFVIVFFYLFSFSRGALDKRIGQCVRGEGGNFGQGGGERLFFFFLSYGISFGGTRSVRKRSTN